MKLSAIKPLTQGLNHRLAIRDGLMKAKQQNAALLRPKVRPNVHVPQGFLHFEGIGAQSRGKRLQLLVRVHVRRHLVNVISHVEARRKGKDRPRRPRYGVQALPETRVQIRRRRPGILHIHQPIGQHVHEILHPDVVAEFHHDVRDGVGTFVARERQPQGVERGEEVRGVGLRDPRGREHGTHRANAVADADADAEGDPKGKEEEDAGDEFPDDCGVLSEEGAQREALDRGEDVVLQVARLWGLDKGSGHGAGDAGVMEKFSLIKRGGGGGGKKGMV